MHLSDCASLKLDNAIYKFEGFIKKNTDGLAYECLGRNFKLLAPVEERSKAEISKAPFIGNL